MITFIGDVHGKFDKYIEIIAKHRNTIQVGDFGLGFSNSQDLAIEEFMRDKSNHKFIRGNHDNIRVCERFVNNFIPDGVCSSDIGYIGGANSIDKHIRVEGINWWRDEEVSYSNSIEILDKFSDLKPRVMVTHDFPSSISSHLFNNILKGKRSSSFTSIFLDEILKVVKPDIWIGGHWHTSRDCVINDTRFICLAELETVTFSC